VKEFYTIYRLIFLVGGLSGPAAWYTYGDDTGNLILHGFAALPKSFPFIRNKKCCCSSYLIFSGFLNSQTE